MAIVLSACGWGGPRYVETSVGDTAIPIRVHGRGFGGNRNPVNLQVRVPECLVYQPPDTPPERDLEKPKFYQDRINIIISEFEGNTILQAFAQIDLEACDNPHEEGELQKATVEISSFSGDLYDGYCITVKTTCETKYGIRL